MNVWLQWSEKTLRGAHGNLLRRFLGPFGGMRNNKLRCALRLAGWNLAWVMAALALLGLAAEVWLRAKVPFKEAHAPTVFVPGLGIMLPPGTEIRWTNKFDFWTVSRTNRLGFLDREPPSPQRAAQGCHIAVIGDSFVAAREVPIADKFHVRLEEMAGQALPHLDISSSAFGRASTGQVNQLPFYDRYARPLGPKLLVLVFFDNDFLDNSPFLDIFSIRRRLDPKHLPYVYAQRAADGRIALRPPDPLWASLAQPPSAPAWLSRAAERAIGLSYLADWLNAKMRILFPAEADPELVPWLESLSAPPDYETLLDGWRYAAPQHLNDGFMKANLSPIYRQALEFTAFALDQFKERARRDGASLIILATHRVAEHGERIFHRLSAMAEARDIPVINQWDYVVRRGGSAAQAIFAHDGHWNALGHQWAAEALLHWLKRNQWVCSSAAAKEERPLSPA